MRFMGVDSPQIQRSILKNVISSSPEDTWTLGAEISSLFKPGDVITFQGELGAGKTTLIKSIVSSIADISEQQITSPTFTYLHIYGKNSPIYHFDLYRIDSSQKFINMGFLDYLEENGISLIEWPQVIKTLLPLPRYEIELAYLDATTRNIVLSQLH